MNVKEVQRRLWEQSHLHKAHRESGTPLFPVNSYDNRIRNLMDLMHHPEWIKEAGERVMRRSRNKAPGVDGVTSRMFRKGYEGKLESLRQELRSGTYSPRPVRQVLIPKANGKVRALGIPCIRDKVVQEAIRMALEPIFEVEFHDNSYGFRPNRNTHHAVFRCQQLMKHRFTWVIEGDVKACFDEISHKAILKVLREKVHDNKFCNLISRFLKAGVEIKGVVKPTEKGVPQGGVISPLLANAVLNKLDWFLHRRGTHGMASNRAANNREPNVRFTRYADDWCVFITRASKRYAQVLREQIRKFLKQECGLELSTEKTRITHVREGFEFLGFHLELSVGKSGRTVPKIQIGTKAKRNLRVRLNEALRYRPQQESIALRLQRGSSVVRGWSEYYRIAHNFPAIAGTLDHWAFWIALKAICRKLDIPTGKAMKKYYRYGTIAVDEFCRLETFAGIKVKLDFRGPEKYLPGDAEYQNDSEMEADFSRYNESMRPGNMDVKLKTLQRDSYRCQKCGKVVTAVTSHVDHIKPVKQFANFTLASFDENLQTLCLDCHKEKHNVR